MASQHEDRFAFGKNWASFLGTVDEQRIESARLDLARLVGNSLEGLTFLDIGSGSGLHSLAAFRLGARQIVSFDYDADSVACTRLLWEREGRPAQWTVCQGSALDDAFLDGLAHFDVVYSWGVLHHTGSMWEAVDKSTRRCKPGGRLVIGLYHKKAVLTPAITVVKRAYVRGGPVRRGALLGGYAAMTVAYQVARRQFQWRDLFRPRQRRGMNWWHDIVDWVGGYPFEAATPEEVRAFVEPRGFQLRQADTHTSFAAVDTFVFERAA